MSDEGKSQSTNRKCGTCTGCCTALGVVEFAKPPGTRCGQVCRTGCRIYTLRPPTCQQFECLWLQGAGGPADRPDRTGVVFSATSSRELGTVVQIHEVTPGAWERSARSQRLGETLARHPPARIASHDPRRSSAGRRARGEHAAEGQAVRARVSCAAPRNGS